MSTPYLDKELISEIEKLLKLPGFTYLLSEEVGNDEMNKLKAMHDKQFIRLSHSRTGPQGTGDGRFNVSLTNKGFCRHEREIEMQESRVSPSPC